MVSTLGGKVAPGPAGAIPIQQRTKCVQSVCVGWGSMYTQGCIRCQGSSSTL